MYTFIDDPQTTHAAFTSTEIESVDWSHILTVTKRDGTAQQADHTKIIRQIEWCTRGLDVDPLSLVRAIGRSLHNGIATTQVNRVAVIEAGNLISIAEPQWTFVAARFVLQELLKVATNGTIEYPTFRAYAEHAAKVSRFDPKLLAAEAGFNWDNLDAAIRTERDFKYDYLGIQTLADRYLLRNGANKVVELPQHFLMRVAVGLAMAEPVEDRTVWAIRFYDRMSEFDYLPSTPTLFNAGTTFPQLSSCFGANTYDDLDSIMDVLKENAHYSKFSGGTSTSYSAIRSSGSIVRSTGGKAKGPMPYAKLFDDMLNAFDQGGKRKGVGAYYIEPWHPNIYDILKARDPGGDARSRTPDAFPALWLNDLFMERVADGGKWSLIDPATDPMLARTYGKDFEERYCKLEAEGKVVTTVEAEDLWHLILSKIFQQGTFWPCFKDENNARYPQRRSGMVHHSNLCTEISLLNSEDVSFVCNLTSINVSNFGFKWNKETATLEWNYCLEESVRTSIRSLDNVISIGFIPHEKGRRFQDLYRSVGLGVMGWAVALTKLGIDYESAEHVQFANELMKQITVTGIDESANLAQERGSFKKFDESDWARGVLPIDTVRKTLIIEEFHLDIETTNAPFLANGYETLREKVKQGMRNSSLFAIAPTATISNIIGVTQCTEPAWDLIQQKENLSGQFDLVAPTVVHNPFGLKIKAAREMDQRWIVNAAAARQLHMDQSQSTNIYVDPNRMDSNEVGEYLDDVYFHGYFRGLKTFYYCYSQAGVLSAKLIPSQPGPTEHFNEEVDGAACFLRPGDPGFVDCEACQ